jgi:DNA-directed RNA polymerase subunit RPC12/RpoP
MEKITCPRCGSKIIAYDKSTYTYVCLKCGYLFNITVVERQ